MGYVLITRNPSNKKLVAIVDNDGDAIAEFSTEDAATEAAHNTTLCKAWGYEIIHVDA
jgi:hypothetical protein